MENLILSFNVVLPLFLCIALGYILKRIGMMEEPVQNGLNKLCFRAFLPIYLFNNIFTTDIAAAFDVKLVSFALIALSAVYTTLMIVIPRIEPLPARRGVLVQAIFRGNFALFGLPVAKALCGESGLGPTSLLVGLTVPVLNMLAVIALETFRGSRPDIKKMILGIASNPLILSSLMGIGCNIAGLRIPEALHKSIIDLGSIATPLSLVALGGSFTFASIAGFRKQLVIGVLGKLVVNPVLVLTFAVLCGFRHEMLVPILVMFGAPTAVSSFLMAQQMDGDGDLAAALVVFTSAFSMLSIFLIIFALKQFMLI